MRRGAVSQSLIGSFLTLVSLTCVLPILLILAISFTAETAIVKYGYSLVPSELSLEAYRTIFAGGRQVFRSYGISVLVTVAGTLGALLITGAAGYTLANPSVKYRNQLAMFFFITMVFNGGMVPWYMICKQVGLMENIWALLIPNLIFSPFNLFLVRNYMREIPISLVESAKLDGANDMTIAFRVYFPLSKPILATVALFVAIGYWNDWWNSIMLVSDVRLYPVQYLLMKLKSDINMMKNLQSSGFAGAGAMKPAESLQMATVMITIAPILLFYPFLQKYIVKGLVIGSVKG
ncbi:MAG: carbohydrate ABC transporter permease [Candidatus Limiplasma sp.]|nr:carbohydrate ABC transporter permease [Candidatus Limiplasma sp.]